METPPRRPANILWIKSTDELEGVNVDQYDSIVLAPNGSESADYYIGVVDRLTPDGHLISAPCVRRKSDRSIVAT